MSTRVELTNAAIDAALAATGDDSIWTRDVPNGFVSRVFPDRMTKGGQLSDSGRLLVTPAKESNRGRGQVFFDVYADDLDGIEVGISIKVSDFSGDDRPPRNSIASGSKAEHFFGLTLAANRSTLLPMLHFWQDASGQWWRCCFDAGRILRDFDANLTDGWNRYLHAEIPNLAACEQVDRLEMIMGVRPSIVGPNKGGAVAISPLSRGSGKYMYLNAKISHAAIGAQWVAVDEPRMPVSYGELLEWMGEEGDLIG